eukprot:13417981-Heterocapsa_arctica.AAC.1
MAAEGTWVSCMTDAQYNQAVVIPIQVPAIPIIIEYIRRYQDTAQQSVAVGHGYIAVHLIDPNQTRAFLEIINCQEYLNEFRIPIR